MVRSAGPAADAGMDHGRHGDADERMETDDVQRWTTATQTDTDVDDGNDDVDDASTPVMSKAAWPNWSLEWKTTDEVDSTAPMSDMHYRLDNLQYNIYIYIYIYIYFIYTIFHHNNGSIITIKHNNELSQT